MSKRVDAKLECAEARSRQAREEFQAKVTALQKRVAKERGDKKAALEARLAQLRSAYQSRHPAWGRRSSRSETDGRSSMTNQQVAGMWHQMKGKAAEQWDKLTERT